MDIQDYLRILRKRWRVIPAVTLLVLALAALMTFLSPKVYESNVQFFVSTTGGDSSDLAQGNTFTQQRVKSYAELITTPKVLSPVATAVGGSTTADELAGKVTAQAPPDTVIIQVAAQDRSPAKAQRIAQQLAVQFPKTVTELESTGKSPQSPVKVSPVRDAELPKTPVSPKPLRNLALALVLGLLLGVAAALLRHRLDTTVRNQDDVQEVTETTVIGGIPFDSDAPAHPLIVQHDPHSGRAEAFRSLRTNLQFVNAANHPRSISVTSSIAGEGKTTTTANLAVALSEAGASVCLIEGDLRRPRLLQYMGLEGGVGLTDVLIGNAELRDVLQPFGSQRLAVLGAGRIPPNPSELLGSQSMRKTLTALLEMFDYVIIDAPPLLPVTDAAVLSTMVDGSLLISGSGIVSRDQLDSAIDSLERVNGTLLGIVLNRVPRTGGSRYYDYRYEYRPHTEADSRRGRRKGKKDGSRKQRKQEREQSLAASHTGQ